MAAYREHITFSSLLGVGYGVGSVLALGFSPVQGALAGCLTAVSGMLPDLDSDTGRPVRELFSLVAAVFPLLLVGRALEAIGWPAHPENVLLMLVCMYLVIRYGGSYLVKQTSVHRGMYHSLPAMAIAAQAVYLAYPSDLETVKLLMAGGVAVGFFSHLALDEMYSVQWNGVRVQLKSSAGSAIKLMGNRFAPNVTTYALLFSLTYLTLVDSGLIVPDPEGVTRQLPHVDGGKKPRRETRETDNYELRHAEAFPDDTVVR